MRWRVSIVLQVSVILMAEGRKPHHGSTFMEKSSNGTTLKAGGRNPSIEEGSKHMYSHSPLRIRHTGGRFGMKDATVPASVISQSMGGDGFFIGPAGNKKGKTTEMRTRKRLEPKKLLSQTAHQPPKDGNTRERLKYFQPGAGTPYQPAVPHIGPGRRKDVPLKSDLLYPKTALQMPQTGTGPFVPQPLTSYFHPHSINPQAAPRPFPYRNQPRRFFGLTLPPSPYMGQTYPGAYVSHAAPGPYMSPGLGMYGMAGGNNGYPFYGTYETPSTNVGENSYGNGLGTRFPSGPGSFPYFPNRNFPSGLLGTQRLAAGLPGRYGPSMYIQSGAEMHVPHRTSRNLPQKDRARATSQGIRVKPIPAHKKQPKTSSRYTRPPKMLLLEELLKQRGATDIYKNVKDLTWSTVKGDKKYFTVTAEFTSLTPTQTVKCTAVITGSETSNVMRLKVDESDVQCVPQNPVNGSHQSRVTPPLGNLRLGQPPRVIPAEGSRPKSPSNQKHLPSVKRRRKHSRLYANKDERATNPESNG